MSEIIKKINKIVVMPVKNEDWIIEKTLKCLSLWADCIIVADQNSDDRTRAIIGTFEKAMLIDNPASFHSSSVRKLLLSEARKIPGDNFIFSFDADEIPTFDIVENIDQLLKDFAPGDSIEMQWLNLWGSVNNYRDDGSVWSNSWKVFGFYDDRICEYTQTDHVNDHTARVPFAALRSVKRVELPKVLHFQFSDLGRTSSKQCRYRMTEYLLGNSSFSFLKINHRYYPSKEQKDIVLRPVNEQWASGYSRRGLSLSPEPSTLNWYDREIVANFIKYGTAKFRWLDIWDIDWNNKFTLLKKEGAVELVDNFTIADPRSLIQKIYHGWGQEMIFENIFFQRIYSWFKKIWA